MNPLGFTFDENSWRGEAARLSKEEAVFTFKRQLSQTIFELTQLEGNPITFAETKTLLDGYSIGNRKLSDVQQVLNLKKASESLIDMLENSSFALNKQTSDELHGFIAYNEALEWGSFRGEGKLQTPVSVSLGDKGEYKPLVSDSVQLNSLYTKGLEYLDSEIGNLQQKAILYFLFASYHQFYFDGNKRTARMMANGLLLENGYLPMNVPIPRLSEYNEKLTDFYVTKDATDMMQFWADCMKIEFGSSLNLEL